MKIRAFAHYAKKLMFFMLFARCATKQGGIFGKKKRKDFVQFKNAIFKKKWNT